MVKGIHIFKEYLHGHEDSFVIIGGTACDQWMTAGGLRFRSTKDIDMVLILEAVSSVFSKDSVSFWIMGYINPARYHPGTKSISDFHDPGKNNFHS